MTLSPIDSPVRIGLVGLGPTGAHHLERIRLRSDLRVVTACDVRAETGRTHPLCENISARLTDLLARDNLEYVLISAPQKLRAELAVRALNEGKNVAVESPPCVNGAQAQELLAAARSPDRTLCVLPTRREGFDFRAARHAVVTGSLGTIEAARIVSWAKAVPPDCAEPARSPGEPEIAPGDEVFTFFAYQYVDQLLQLIRRPPQSVFARISHPPDSDPTATAFFLSVAFADGADALIDVNLHAGAALQTGWLLAGTSGAYCQQRIHLTEPSGEVCDAPVAPDEVPQVDLYADLLQPARLEKDRLRSIREAATVMHILDAARQSSKTCQVVEIGEAIGQ
jgi:predicted dehydrogenase